MFRATGAAALLRVLLLTLSALAVVVAPASALSMQPLTNDAENVVQQGEADVAPDSSTIPQNTERFLAHAYAFGVANSGSPLGAVAGPVLRFRYIGKRGPSTFVTLLDFDRDFLPDLAVRYEPEIKNESSTNDTTTVSLYDVKGLGTTSCLSDLPTAKRIGATFTVATENPNEGAANGQIPLKTAYGSAGLTEGLMRTVPPRMVTIVTANFGSATIKPNRTTYPAAAKNDDNTACAGLGYDFSNATGHTTGAADDSTFERTDATPSTEIVNADLRRIAVKQWTRTSTREDAVVGTNQAARTTYPSELSIDFGSTKGVASLTYLWAAKTWTRTSARSTPNALIRTESVSGNANRIKVIVTSKLGQGTLNDVIKERCLARVPTGAGALVSTFEFPLITANGNRRLTLALDDLLGSGGAAVSGTAASKTWRFQTLSDPGADASAAIDIVPALAGYSVDGTTRGAGCTNGTDGGANVILDRTNTVGVTQPKVNLIPSTLNPARGEDVTFTLDTDAGDRLCSLTEVFALTACTTLTQRYTQAKTDTYLTLDTSSGAWDADRETIALGNSRPTATIGAGAGTQPPVGTDNSYAIVRGNAVSVPLAVTGTDADPGTTYTYAWTLDGSSSPVSTDQTYTPTFSVPGTYVVRATVDDGSGQSNSTSTAAIRTIEVVRAPEGDVTIDQPARSVAGQPFDLAAQLAGTGHQTLTWSWDLDGDGDYDVDPAKTGKTLSNVVIDTPGERVVRVRATDAGGRIADASATINVRRANERPPVASYSVTPAKPSSGATAAFDASQSQLSDTDGTLLGPIGAARNDVKYRWDFGDGTATVTTTAPVTNHTFAGSGPSRVTLVVEDARATPSTLSNPLTKTIDVAPGATDANAPRVQFARQDPPPADPVFANRPVTVTAAGTTAADGHAPLTYAFDLDGNGSYEKSNGAEPTVRFTPTTAGALTVRVQVTDAIGAKTVKALELDVKPEPVKAPTATVTGPAELRLTGLTVGATYDATGSTGNNLDPALTYRWDLDDDGTFETPTGADPKVSAGFASPGVKTITVRVADRYGNTAEAKTTTVVRSPADVAAGCTGRSSLQEVAYKTVRARGCALTVARPSAGPLYVLTGAIRVNGLQLVDGVAGSGGVARAFADCQTADCAAVQSAYNAAGAGLQITLDPSDGSLRSNKPASLRASGSGIDLPLGTGPLNVSLPQNPTDTISLSSRGGLDLFGFPLAGPVAVRFPDDGETTITLTVSLPAVAGGFTGQAAIRVTSTGTVVFDELRINVGEISLGSKLSLGDLSFVYSRPDDLWSGGGSITIPSPKPLTISAEVSVQRNKFKSISAEVSGINQPIAQAIYLQAIRAGVSVDPLDLTAGVQVSAGPSVKGKSVLALDGDLRLKFPSAAANYYLFALTGKLSFGGFQLATGFAQFSSNGFFEMGGGIDVDFEIAYLKAYLSGWITANAFNVDGTAEVGLTIGGRRYGLAAARATLSTTGFAACGEIPVLDLGGGFGARWGGDVDTFWGCDLSPYRAARPADAPATPTFGNGARAIRTDATRGRLLVAGPRGHAIRIPAGAEKVLLTATGSTAPPRLTIVDAKGAIQLSTPADGTETLTKRMMVKANAKTKTTQVLWKAPTAGTLYVLEQAGSSPVTKVETALPAPKRKITAKVLGSGSKRTLDWSVSPPLLAGQTITLAEEGKDAGTELVNATAASSGRTPFAPQGGRAGKRSITATIVTDGLPGEKQTVGTYSAPNPPAPARPASVQLARSTSGVMVRWTPGVGGRVPAAKWKVYVRVAHTGRKQLLTVPAKQTSLRIADVTPGDAVSVEVYGESEASIDGPRRIAIVRAGLRASSGPRSLASTAKPRDVKVQRLESGRLRITWKTGGAFVRGWSIRVTPGVKGQARGPITLLRAAGTARSVEVAGIADGPVRVSVIGRRYQGSVTRKDVRYLGGSANRTETQNGPWSRRQFAAWTTVRFG